MGTPPNIANQHPDGKKKHDVGFNPSTDVQDQGPNPHDNDVDEPRHQKDERNGEDRLNHGSSRLKCHTFIGEHEGFVFAGQQSTEDSVNRGNVLT